MRPVTRDDAATYPGPGRALATLLRVLDDHRAAAAAARARIDAVTADLAARQLAPPRKRARGASRGSLDDILAARPGLDTTYAKRLAAKPGNQKTRAALTAAAGALVTNLKAEIDWYAGFRDREAARLSDAYGRARGDLIEQLGEYCSYCEIPLAAALAVEHMLPKSEFPVLTLTWENFLLACPVCNSRKAARPRRVTGEAAAGAAGAHPPYLEADVQAGAWSAYVWPSDAAGYPRWEDVFTYQVADVRYAADAQRVSAAAVPPEEVARWAFGTTSLEVVSEAGYAITARVKTLLAESPSFYAVRDALDAGAVAPELAAMIAALPPGVTLATVPAPVVAAVGTDTWRLTQTGTFRIDTTRQPEPRLYAVAAGGGRTEIQSFPMKNTGPQRVFLRDLSRGVLPPVVATALAAAPYLVDAAVQDVAVRKLDPTTFEVVVTKTLDAAADGDFVQVLTSRLVDLEVWVAPLAGPTHARAAQMVEDLRLNAVDRTDTEFSDRRVLRRTRAFLLALDAVRRLNAVVTSGGAASVPAVELRDLIARTAVATGYWSVWRHVFATYLAEGVRDELSAFLRDVGNFPGTR